MEKNTEKLILTERKPYGALVTLNRPKALNALNPQLLTELREELEKLDEDPSCRVVILTGSGTKAFAAGADIASMSTMTPAEASDFARCGHAVMDLIGNMRAIVIAAVNGYALGGGCELSLACDFRIASTRAKFGIPEVTLGVIPGFGGTQRLARIVGQGFALELLATGAQLSATEALNRSLVNHLSEPDDLISDCEDLAAKIAGNSSFAISLGKRSIREGLEMDLAKGLSHEAALFSLCFAHPDQKEGMTAFLEKRKPDFQ